MPIIANQKSVMKNSVAQLFLLAAFLIIGNAVACGGGATLEIPSDEAGIFGYRDESASLSLFEDSEGCSPETSCVLKCECGKKQHVKLTKFAEFNKSKYSKVCRRTSLSTWLSAQLEKAKKSTKVHKGVFECLVAASFEEHVQHFAQRCKNDGLLKTSLTMDKTAKKALKSFHCQSSYKDVPKLELRAALRASRKIYLSFKAELKKRTFEFCSCNRYLKTLTKPQKLKTKKEKHSFCKKSCAKIE